MQRLLELLDTMRARSLEMERELKGWTGFDAVLIPSGTKGYVDVTTLGLTTYGVGWEACCEVDGKYDLWHQDAPVEFGLTRDAAAERLLVEYDKAKRKVVVERRARQN
jgi:hypothetical protein